MQSQRLNNQAPELVPRAYSSNPVDQEQFNTHFSNYVYHQPVDSTNRQHIDKQQVQETINSEESFPSVNSFDESRIPQSVVHDEQFIQYDPTSYQPDQKLESHDNSLQQPIMHNQIDIENLDVQKSQHQIFKPLQVKSVKGERSFDLISGYTHHSNKRVIEATSSIHTFYYDRIGNQVSRLFPQGTQDKFKYIMINSIVPIVIVFLLFVINYFIQRRINDFCYIKDSFCPCSSFGVKIWSWARQLIFLKLGFMCYKKLILCRISMGSNNLSHKEPILEYFTLFFLIILFDLIMVIWIWNNQDYVYIVFVYILGIVALLNTFRIRDWGIIFKRGRAIFFYDFCLVGIICYAFYFIPNVMQTYYASNGQSSGLISFLYVYPLIDWLMEIIMDLIISHSQFAELFIYQIQLIVIGIRVSLLCSVRWSTFSFWYLLIFLGTLRANNSSMFLTVFLRRWAFYSLPAKFQSITKMNETPRSLKGKHGAYLEHQVWIFFYYFFYLTETTVPFYVKNTTMIQDCTFSNNNWSPIINHYQPLIVWVGLGIGELLGLLFNRELQYDNIKLLGGTALNMVENIFVRLTGYYLFQMAIMVPFMVTELNDITKQNQHYLTVTTIQN